MKGLRLVLTAAVVVASYAATVPVAQSAITCQSRPVTQLGSPGDDVLRGGPGADVIAGLGGSDRIFGLGGDDVLCGGDGADLLIGGPGDDRLDGGAGGFGKVEGSTVRIGDELVGGPGDDRIDPGANNDEPRRNPGTFAWDIVNLSGAERVTVDLRKGTVRGQGRDVLVRRPMALFLTRGDDVVRSSGLPVAVWSGAGDDRITTHGGDDAIFADGGGSISFLGGPGSIGSGGADVVCSGPGNDRVETGAGRDTVRSGSGDDRVQSGAGRDTILTGPGADDVLELGRGADVIDAGLGKDVVDDVLAGRPGESVTTGPREPRRPDWLLVNARRPVTWDMAAAVAVVRGVTITLAAARTNDVSGRRWVVSGTDQGEYLGALTGRPAEFRGLGGPDRFSGNFDLADLFDGGDGEDTYVSGEKRNNTCISVEHDPGPSCKP